MNSLRPIPRVTIHAFCESEGVAEPVRRASLDRRMAKAHLKMNMGGIAAAIEFYRDAPTPNLIIIESRMSAQELMAALGDLAEHCDANTKVAIIGHFNDVWLYRELMRSGVSEYTVAPLSLADVLRMISELFMDPDKGPIGKSFAFVGVKGGVGASSIAHNLAWTLSQNFELETVLADMDLAFGTANINFDQDPPQGISEAVFSPDRLDEMFIDRLLAKCGDHLSLLAAPSTLDRAYDFSADAFVQVIEVMQRTAPHVVLDIPHVWTAWAKATLIQADAVVIVATPDLACLRNAKNLVDMLRRNRPNDSTPYLILNQVGMPKRPEISAADFSHALDIQPSAQIPFDPALFGTATNNGRMIGELQPKHPISQSFNEIANMLTGRVAATTKKNSSKLGGLAGLIDRLKRK
nr:CpaE family protein [Limoniibacter endophyticus]